MNTGKNGMDVFIDNVADTYFHICLGMGIDEPLDAMRWTESQQNTFDRITEKMGSPKDSEDENGDLLREYTADIQKQAFTDGFKCALKMIQSQGNG